MNYQFSESELAAIESKLPPQYAALKEQYPRLVAAAAEFWDVPPYPQGYLPQTVDIYYADDAPGPALTVHNGNLAYIDLREPVPSPEVIAASIDDDPAYIQIRGRVILNRLGGARLPDVVIKPDVLLQSTLDGIVATPDS